MPVIHIQAAFEQNPPLIDAKQIALLQMVVDHGAQQIVRRSNGMHISGKMQVDIFHRTTWE